MDCHAFLVEFGKTSCDHALYDSALDIYEAARLLDPDRRSKNLKGGTILANKYISILYQRNLNFHNCDQITLLESAQSWLQTNDEYTNIVKYFQNILTAGRAEHRDFVKFAPWYFTHHPDNCDL
jgi:hypothetical protein